MRLPFEKCRTCTCFLCLASHSLALLPALGVLPGGLSQAGVHTVYQRKGFPPTQGGLGLQLGHTCFSCLLLCPGRPPYHVRWELYYEQGSRGLKGCPCCNAIPCIPRTAQRTMLVWVIALVPEIREATQKRTCACQEDRSVSTSVLLHQVRSPRANSLTSVSVSHIK